MKLKVEVPVTKEDIDNIMDAAMSGCTYWCDSVDVDDKFPKGATFISQVISRGGKVRFLNSETMRYSTLTLEKLLKGIALSKNVNFDDYDMYDADKVVQYALFGEQRYA